MQSAIFIGFFAVTVLILINFKIAKKIGSLFGKMME